MPAGDLWLNGLSGIVHIGAEEAERAVRDPAVSCRVRSVSGAAKDSQGLPPIYDRCRRPSTMVGDVCGLP